MKNSVIFMKAGYCTTAIPDLFQHFPGVFEKLAGTIGKVAAVEETTHFSGFRARYFMIIGAGIRML